MEIHPIAVGVVIAAGITGLISLLGLIISKEQKTSEFRQQWIDSLRNEISELIGYTETGIQHLTVILRDKKATPKVCITPSDSFDKVKTEIMESEKYYTRILLRVNPKKHKELMGSLKKLKEVFNSDNIPSPEKLDEIETELIQVTQRTLKSEWDRVKKGEPIFKFAKYGAFFLLCLSFIAFGYIILSHPSTPSGSNNQIQVTPKSGPPD